MGTAGYLTKSAGLGVQGKQVDFSGLAFDQCAKVMASLLTEVVMKE